MNFLKPKIEYEIVEGERPRPVHEDEESIRALATHPGFVQLINRLRLQLMVLETRLKRQEHEDLKSVIRLQEGLKWIGFLEDEVNRTVFKKAEAKAVAVRPDEREQFERVIAQIQGI